MEAELKDIGALTPNEKVKLAYKCGRDMTICTSKRVMFVDTQGISGNFFSQSNVRLNYYFHYSFRKES